MSNKLTGLGSWPWDRWLLLALSCAALCIWKLSPLLIQPYPHNTNWFESAALFPQLSLLIVAVGGLFEIYQRRHQSESGESEEQLKNRATNTMIDNTLIQFFIKYII
jgi:hypothetical protein